MEILVYGAGAVGGYLGGKLALAGHQVTLVTRPEPALSIQRLGLLITQAGITSQATVRAVGDLTEAYLEHNFELVILGMKSYDLEAALSSLRRLRPGTPQIMSLQNGIGIEEMINRYFATETILAGAITIPISRRGKNHLEVEREGRGLGLAPVDSGRDIREWRDLFGAAGINTGIRPDYRAMKWSKVFLNIMGNATSAILNRSPVEVYSHAGMFDLEMRMLGEMLAVMRRSDIDIINLPGASARPLAHLVSYAPKPLLRLVFTQVIIHGRGDKMPSFQIDLAAGKECSEVVYHNGAVARTGSQVGVATPVNSLLNDVLTGIMTGQVERAEYDGRPERLLSNLTKYESN
ncbi:MAG: 2-dehydropantoate 2-reductase [Chloroflexota bacterium]|jgi:2-dehydropantoate 2-reductase